MKQTLGLAKLRWTVWQQDDAKAHQAKMGMEWLGTRTGCMPSSARGGTPWPPTHLIPTHVISFFGGTWKRKCTNLSLETWLHWRVQLGVEFVMIPEVMVRKYIMKMTKRGDLRVGVSPLKHLMASILSWKMVSSHFITILAWCGLTPSCCHTVHLSLASPRACLMVGKALFSNSCLQLTWLTLSSAGRN